jgi:hypothetical protein
MCQPHILDEELIKLRYHGVMQATFLIRVSSQLLHSLMGGVALFCLYYACQISDPDIVRYLLIEAVKWGAPAAAILYAQIRYLDR